MSLGPGGATQPRVDSDVLQAFYESAGDGLLLINRAKRIVMMNPAASQITGWQGRDLNQINCSVFNCRDEQGRKTCDDQCLAQKCVESGQPIGPMFLRLSRAGGGSSAVEATFMPPRSGAGPCMLLIKDITVLEGLDHEVRRLNGEIAEKNMVLRGFSEQMSTAWRAAMIDLRGSAEGLRARYARELGDGGMKLTDRMVQATQKLEQTFAQIKSQILVATQSKHPPKQ